MQILLLAIGRCRAAYAREGIEEYARRLRRYAAFTHTELKEARALKNTAPAEVIRREGERLLRALPEGAHVVALHPAGRTCTSEALADRIGELGLHGQNRLAFCIGGAYGLSPDVIRRAHCRLSLSPMTFPHELARLILMEQLYRAFTILRGENYHK